MESTSRSDPGAAGSAQRDDVADLIKRLDPLAAERVVLSALLVAARGGLVLTHAALLIGPAAMSRLSWSDWVRHEGGRELGLPPKGTTSAAFVIKRKKFTLARTSLTVHKAHKWLVGALAGETPTVGPVPAAQAALGPTRAPALARPGNATPASGFVYEAERPVRGFLFPVSTPATAIPTSLTHLGQALRCAQLVGIDVPTTESRVGVAVRPGVFIGRLTRRAWIARVAYDRDDELLTLWLRPERADPYELELEIREYVGDDLADCRRVRLADIPIPARARSQLFVRLPTLGRRVQRTVSLYGRGGELLDEHVRFGIVERGSLTINFDDTTTYTTTIGDKRAAPTAVERLTDLQRVEESYEWWLAEGAKRRIISGVDATALLRRRLRRADRELLILDSYFGKYATDWDLLEGIKVPVRLLTGRDAKPPAIPLARLTARKWMQIPIPFHDRFYVWGSGGLNVGASPSGLKGLRAFRIDELGLAEMNAVRDAFAKWWRDPMAQPL